jgi:hypothetical protein
MDKEATLRLAVRVASAEKTPRSEEIPSALPITIGWAKRAIGSANIAVGESGLNREQAVRIDQGEESTRTDDDQGDQGLKTR